MAARLGRESGAQMIAIIGGGTIYEQTIGIADRLEITEVAASPDGDVRFPEIDKGRWREVSREGPVQGEKDTAAVSFVTYERLTY